MCILLESKEINNYPKYLVIAYFIHMRYLKKMFFSKDFPNVNWVVQLDCPEDTNTYIHRVGRTAR